MAKFKKGDTVFMLGRQNGYVQRAIVYYVRTGQPWIDPGHAIYGVFIVGVDTEVLRDDEVFATIDECIDYASMSIKAAVEAEANKRIDRIIRAAAYLKVELAAEEAGENLNAMHQPKVPPVAFEDGVDKDATD